MSLQSYFLSDEEKKFFDANGYVGPYTLFTPEETKGIWNNLRKELLDVSQAVYPGAPYNYDRHFDIPFLTNFISMPEIVQRVQSILGSDLFMWRSEFFSKHRGDPGTAWHQVERFSVGKQGAQLVPTENQNGLWQLTVWLALTPSTIENGCFRVMPGTHNKWYFNEDAQLEYRPDEESTKSFYGYNYSEAKIDPNWQPDESKAVSFEMEAGQFIIFTSKLMHGSLPNTAKSGPGRISVTARYAPTHVKCYPDRDYFEEFGEKFYLEKFSCVLVSGEDTYKHNKMADKNLLGMPFMCNPGIST